MPQNPRFDEEDIELGWYLESAAWLTHAACPRCGVVLPRETNKVGYNRVERYRCPSCKRTFTMLSGTALERTKYRLSIWFDAAQAIVRRESCRHFAQTHNKQLPYAHAFRMYQALRAGALWWSQRQPMMRGTVEVDEALVVAGHKGRQPKGYSFYSLWKRAPRRNGLKPQPTPPRWSLKNDAAPVLAAVTRGVRGPRLRVMARRKGEDLAKTLPPMIDATQARLMTDGWFAYIGVARNAKIPHAAVKKLSQGYVTGSNREVHTQTVNETVVSMRSVLRPHRGVNQRYLPSYLAVAELLIRYYGEPPDVTAGRLLAFLVKAEVDPIAVDPSFFDPAMQPTGRRPLPTPRPQPTLASVAGYTSWTPTPTDAPATSATAIGATTLRWSP